MNDNRPDDAGFDVDGATVSKFLVVVLLSVSLAACASTAAPLHHVFVNSFSSPDVHPGLRYVLLPAGGNAAGGGLEFREYAGYVHGALREKGYVRVADVGKADLLIHLAYGIRAVDAGVTAFHHGGSDQYRIGPIAVSEHRGSTTAVRSIQYHRWLHLSAVDLHRYRRDRSSVEVWTVSAQSQGSTNDLRLLFPSLVAAARHFIAQTSLRTVQIDIAVEDEQVVHVRATASP